MYYKFGDFYYAFFISFWNIGGISFAREISQQIDDDNWGEGGAQQNQDLPRAAKALATLVGVAFPMIASSSEKVTPRHW